MAPFTNAKKQVSIGRENVYGTAAANLFYFGVTECNIHHRIERAEDNTAKGNVAAVNGSEITAEYSEINISGPLFFEVAPFFLLGSMGAISSSDDDPATGANTHTLTELNSNQKPSFTLCETDDVEDARQATGCVFTSFEVTVDKQGHVTYSASLVGKTPSIAAKTENFTAVTRMTNAQATVKIAADFAGLPGASVTPLTNIRLAYENNAERHHELGSTEPTRVLNKDFRIEGDFTAAFEASTIYDLFKANTKRALRLAIVNGDSQVGGEDQSILLDFAPGALRDWEKSGGRSDIVMQQAGFVPEFDLAANKLCAAVIVNGKDESTYAAS